MSFSNIPDKVFTPLVVGGDGFIGNHLVAELRRQEINPCITVYARDYVPDNNVFHLDLAEPDLRWLEQCMDITHAFICAQYGSIDECKTQPKRTRTINVAGVKVLLEAMKPLGIMPVFLSSNMVFSGEFAYCSEQDMPNPQTEYGRQKFEIEEWLRANYDAYLIVRLTKVFGDNGGDGTLFVKWMKSWREGEAIRAFTDLRVSPLWVRDAVRAMVRLARGTYTGPYHLGGLAEQTYAVYAREMADIVDVSRDLIEDISIQEMKIIERRSVYNSLQSDKAKEAIGFSPTALRKIFKPL